MTDKLFTQAEKIKGYGSYSSDIPKNENINKKEKTKL